MNCFFCATPYHIIASITMACGNFADKDSTLVILNHFDIKEEMVQRIRDTGIFKEVLLYNSNNKTKFNKAKRLANVFLPHGLIYRLANKTAFEHCVFFALDFLNLAYMVKRYQKRSISCEFAFGDDGIGTYMDRWCYQPKKFVVKLLKLTGRLTALNQVQKLYAYKPQLMVENTSLEKIKILQSPEIHAKVQHAVSKIFVIEPDVDINDAILYFEQPAEFSGATENIAEEQRLLKLAAEKLNKKAVVKMHPRSTEKAMWSDFPIMKTKIPFEAMILQKNYAPVLMMSNTSTAMLSVYLLDHLSAGQCLSVFLNRLVPNQNESWNQAMERYFDLLNTDESSNKLLSPVNEQEFCALLEQLAAEIR